MLIFYVIFSCLTKIVNSFLIGNFIPKTYINFASETKEILDKWLLLNR